MTTTLLVYPNPWLALDKNGVPCAVCPRDPDKDAGGPLQFVGARIDRGKTRVTQKLEKGDDLRSPLQTTQYEYMGIAADDPELRQKLFALDPIEIPSTRYYRERLRDRSLLSSNEVCAEVVRRTAFEAEEAKRVQADTERVLAELEAKAAAGAAEIQAAAAETLAAEPEKTKGRKASRGDS